MITTTVCSGENVKPNFGGKVTSNKAIAVID